MEKTTTYIGQPKLSGMPISKAIKILHDILEHVEPGDPPEEHDAVKLGIEALKIVHSIRIKQPVRIMDPMEGEIM